MSKPPPTTLEAPPLPGPAGEVVPVVGAAILRAVPKEACGCLVTRRGAHVSSPGLWELPGGKVEPGESPRQALRREICEELGLEIEVGDFLARGTADQPGRRIVLDVYESRILGGALRLSDHDAWLWIGPGRLGELSWADADRPVLPTLEARLTTLVGQVAVTPVATAVAARDPNP